MCLGRETCCCDEAAAEQAAATEEEGTVSAHATWTVPCYACGEPMEPGISWHRGHDARSPAEREIDRQVGIDAAERDRAAQQGQTAYVPCPDCAGSGIDGMDGSMYCPLCDGNGTVAPAVAASVSTEYKEWAGPHRAG